MSELMNAIMMFLTGIVALIAIGVAVQNNRSIDKIEDIESRTIEALTMSKQELHARIDDVVNSENAWRPALEKKCKENKDEIDKLVAKMDEYAKTMGKLDEVDFRSRRAQATASDAARCVILNGSMPNGGVDWAGQFPDQEGDHE